MTALSFDQSACKDRNGRACSCREARSENQSLQGASGQGLGVTEHSPQQDLT